jgi:hypothetical protein
MGLKSLFLQSFKKGQFDITEDCKSQSDTGKVISIDDGDVTTYIYEKTSVFKLEELGKFVGSAFGESENYVATYSEDQEGNITVFYDGSCDNQLDGVDYICFFDEFDNEEYWNVFTGDTNDLLVTSSYLSVDEVLKAHTHLSISKKGKV